MRFLKFLSYYFFSNNMKGLRDSSTHVYSKLIIGKIRNVSKNQKHGCVHPINLMAKTSTYFLTEGHYNHLTLNTFDKLSELQFL